MPPRIQVLPETLANQIAAGEVVERPAAVVKELVENALDAGARRIDVELLEGGIRLVSVRDDGCGMGRDDALLCLQRHATSKLRSKDDLFAVSTFGFRGEALPSIAAVSRFTLLTCEAGALAGTRVRVEGGQVGPAEDAGAPPGTTVEVRDLFWNVPARRKFLKRPPTEQSYAVEALLKLALPRLEVAFSLRDGDRTLFRSAASATLSERATEALGSEVREALLPFEGSVRGVRAWGLAASPDVTAGNGRGIWLFVNGRAVRDRQLAHAVLQAYGEVLPHGRYPSALVFVEVPPAEVDVNVHPAKAEVRLSDARAAYEAIRGGIAGVLVRGSYLHLPGSQSVEELQVVRVGEAIERHGERMDPAPRPPPAQQPLVAPPPYFGGLRYLGQVHRTYLVCEGPRGLVLVDQHAAHERMNYQRLRRAAKERNAGAQPLLVPLVVALAAPEAELVEEAAPALSALGIEVAPYGGGSVAIQALPAALARLSAREAAALLSDLAVELEAQGRSPSLDRVQDALLARAACHASVRAHDALAPPEAQALLNALDETDYGARCAHGRPVVAEWTIAEVERRFGRDYETHAHAAAPEVL